MEFLDKLIAPPTGFYSRSWGMESKNKADSIWRFGNLDNDAFGLQKGDLLVLRLGRKAYAVGKVVTDYLWDSRFVDVRGWNLSHYRRTRWSRLQPDILAFPQRMPMFTRLDNKAKYRKLVKIAKNVSFTKRLPHLPKEPKIILKKDFNKKAKGMSKAIDALFKIKRDFEKLKNAIEQNTGDFSPSERELAFYFLFPLLTALGWHPGIMAFEHSIPGVGRLDVALFRKPSRQKEDIVGIIESKKLWKDLEGETVQEQVKSYLKRIPNIRFVLVSSGWRNIMYTRWKGPFRCCGSLFLRHLSEFYPTVGRYRHGAIHFIKWLNPSEWID